MKPTLTLLTTLLFPPLAGLHGADEKYENNPEHLRDSNLIAPQSAESAHFRIVWGRGLSQDFTESQAKGTLRNFL